MSEIKTNLEAEDGVSDYYEVRPVNLNKASERKHAYKELQMLQTRCLSDYKTWAKEYVKYQDFGKGKNVDVKLKQCNDQYTLSMFMSVLGPLREGISLETIFTSYMTYNIAKMTNPNMDEDMSRLFMNFRSSLVDAASKSSGVSGMLLNKLVKHTDERLLSTSADLMNNNIAANLNNHTLDSMAMSPRQLAVLKLNFMEQFYVDSRSIGDLSKIENRDKYFELKHDYDAAIRHIEAIANNSGYSMDVVSVEERYFVGLKLAQNPDYANIFNETKSVINIRPEYDEDGAWSGRFITADGHAFTTGGSKVGTFTVRRPYNLDKNPTLGEDDNSHKDGYYGYLDRCTSESALLFASAQSYVDSEYCELSKSEKNYLKAGIRDAAGRFRSQLASQMRDDGLFDGSKKKIEKYLSENFDAAIASPEDKKNLPQFKHFHENVEYIVEKEILNTQRDELIAMVRNGGYPGKHIFPNAEDRNAIMNAQVRADISDDIAKRFLQYKADKRSKIQGIDDKRMPDEVLRDTVNNYIDGMSSEERLNLMLHTCSNMLSTPKEHDYKAPLYTISRTDEEKKARRGQESENGGANSSDTFDALKGVDEEIGNIGQEKKSKQENKSKKNKEDRNNNIPDIPDDAEGPDGPDGPDV